MQALGADVAVLDYNFQSDWITAVSHAICFLERLSACQNAGVSVTSWNFAFSVQYGPTEWDNV